MLRLNLVFREFLKNQLLQIRCADLTTAKQARFLQSLEAVFTQFQIDLMQIEIKENV